MSSLTALAPYLVLIAAGFLPNEIWRMLGIVVAHGLDEGSELVVWVRAVATALLAGVIARIILFPPGGLADVPLTVRLLAMAAGFAAFALVRRSVLRRAGRGGGAGPGRVLVDRLIRTARWRCRLATAPKKSPDAFFFNGGIAESERISGGRSGGAGLHKARLT